MYINMIHSLALSETSDIVEKTGEALEAAASGRDVQERTGILFGFLGEKLKEIGSNLLGALIIAVIGWYVVKLLCKAFEKLFNRSKLDESVSRFLMSIVKTVLRLILIITVGTALGIEMASFVTLLASAGLAISLSLQGCFTNFAGGVLILILKPFTAGDYIVDGNGNEGTVTAIDIIYTHLLTPDNRAVVIPNGNLANSTVTNVTKEPVRRIDFNISIDYEESIEKVTAALEALGRSNPMVLQDREIHAFVNKFDASAIDIILRVWVRSCDYWTLRGDMQYLIKKTFDEKGIVIPYSKLDVNIVSPGNGAEAAADIRRS